MLLQMSSRLIIMIQMFAKSLGSAFLVCRPHKWDLNSSAVSWLICPAAPGYKGANQNYGMTWAGNDTYLYSCQNWTESLHHQIFHNPFCSDNLTEARGKWRCSDVNITDNINDRGHRDTKLQPGGVTGSTLTLSASTSGLFILCGNRV